MLTLGSLFDGAGTFPFAAQQCGVKALWASEIEPFPVEVTKKRFPDMKHLGDICNGTNPGHHQGVLVINKLHTEVRRLTPTECGRLQGMPDWWCEDVPHSDSAEYKMWGNGMALPNVLYVMENVVSALSVRALNSLLEVSE